MAKLSLTNIVSLESQTTAIAAINSNNAAIIAALDNTFSLDGETPNQLNTDLDMNGHHLLNIPSPVNPTDAARLVDITNGVITITGFTAPSVIGNSGKILSTDGATIFWSTPTTGALLSANNLSDLGSVTTALTNLGLGTSAVKNTGTSGATVPLLNGGNTWSGTQTFIQPVLVEDGLQVTAGEMRLSSTPATLNTDSAGYRGAPQNVQSGNYTFALSDAGSGVTNTGASAIAWTIPPNSSVAFPIHTVIVLDNLGAGAATITRGAGVTLRSNGSGTSADKVLNQYQVASIYQVATDVWVSTGI